MLKNYIKIALRNIQKQKIYTSINVFGLAIGMTCCILIFLFVQHELSYDKFHENYKDIYRLGVLYKFPTGDKGYSTVISVIPPVLAEEFPEIRDYVRLFNGGNTLTQHKDKQLKIRAAYVDPAFLKIFSFQLIKGNRETSLNEPNTAVITEELAEKYFGEEDPIGKIITVDNKIDVLITGVLKSIPDNSHINFDLFASYESARNIVGSDFFDKGTLVTAYLLLKKGTASSELEKKIILSYNKFHEGRLRIAHIPFLQPLGSIHLNSKLALEISKNSDIKYSYYLSILAFAILIIACINFMNLSTARSLNRSKEIGLRKVVGSTRSQLIRQFLLESVLISLISIFLALIFTELLLPYFNNFADKNLKIELLKNPELYLGLAVITVFTGIFSGCYPSLIMSGYKPVNILGSRMNFRSGPAFLRKGLVIFQFILSITFIFSSLILVSQLNYVKNKELGFTKDNIITFFTYRLEDRAEIFKKEILSLPGVINAAFCGILPGIDYNWPSMIYTVDETEKREFKMPVIDIDENYFESLDINVVSGRNFDKYRSGDIEASVLINESAAKEFGWDSPIGKRISIQYQDTTTTIIGVVEDVHFESLRREIKPFIFYYYPKNPYQMLARISSNNTSETIGLIRDSWLKFNPNFIFDYKFLDERFDDLYKEEKRNGKIIGLSSILSVIIACLGLFGLASYTAEKRTKEIGIRKVLGASVSNIIKLISNDFIKLLVIANVIALPVAYYVMEKWLQNFAYRINVGIWLFLSTVLIAFMIALFTVSFQAVKAAMANPVNSLRQE